MSLEAAILGFLGEQPRSGYDLKTRCFDEALRDFWTADQAQIYRTLDRLQAAKLVSVTRKRTAGRPDRKVYSLTDLGRSALATWMGSTAPTTPPRDAFLLQLYFSADSPDNDVHERLAQRRALHQSRLESLRAHAETAAHDTAASARQTALRQAAFGGAMAVERAAIDWLDDCLGELVSGHVPQNPASGAGRLTGPSSA